LLRLYVPPGTIDDEQQFVLPDGPQVAARPLQLAGPPASPLLAPELPPLPVPPLLLPELLPELLPLPLWPPELLPPSGVPSELASRPLPPLEPRPELLPVPELLAEPSPGAPPSETIRKSSLRNAGHPARAVNTTIAAHRATQRPCAEVMSLSPNRQPTLSRVPLRSVPCCATRRRAR
jgi:hypothetical protein